METWILDTLIPSVIWKKLSANLEAQWSAVNMDSEKKRVWSGLKALHILTPMNTWLIAVLGRAAVELSVSESDNNLQTSVVPFWNKLFKAFRMSDPGRVHMGKTRSANGQGLKEKECNPLEDSDIKCYCSGQSDSTLCLL